MSTVRHLFSARTARPKLEATMRALVQSAVLLASADGSIEESELESLIDGLRAVVARSVGMEHLDDYATVAKLLDEARAAIRELSTKGEPALLAEIATVLEGDFRRDALKLALEVVKADGAVSPAETKALERLATAVSVDVSDLS